MEQSGIWREKRRQHEMQSKQKKPQKTNKHNVTELPSKDKCRMSLQAGQGDPYERAQQGQDPGQPERGPGAAPQDHTPASQPDAAGPCLYIWTAGGVAT